MVSLLVEFATFLCVGSWFDISLKIGVLLVPILGLIATCLRAASEELAVRLGFLMIVGGLFFWCAAIIVLVTTLSKKVSDTFPGEANQTEWTQNPIHI